MGKRKQPPNTWQDFDPIREQFMDQLVKESDRGCVLVAAAMLDPLEAADPAIVL
jgi:hypothetical protein